MNYIQFSNEVKSKSGSNDADLQYIGKFGDVFQAKTKSGKLFTFDTKTNTWVN